MANRRIATVEVSPRFYLLIPKKMRDKIKVGTFVDIYEINEGEGKYLFDFDIEKED